MALSTLFSLWHSIRLETSHVPAILALVFFSGVAAYFLATITLNLLIRNKRLEVRLSASFLVILIFTIGITSIVYAIDYWSFYTRWHGEPLSILWMIQMAFTMLGGLYQFAVMGLKLYMPIGLFCLIAASIFLANT